MHRASTCHMDVATAEGRQASRSRAGPRTASDSPVPGESRMLEQPGQTKNLKSLTTGLKSMSGWPASLLAICVWQLLMSCSCWALVTECHWSVPSVSGPERSGHNSPGP